MIYHYGAGGGCCGGGGTGGGSTTFNIRDYINEWMTANPDYLKDQIGTSWDNYLAGIGGFDPSQFMTNQQFQNYMSNYQPDFSNYMTNQAFQDYMSNYQPDLDMSQYVTQGGLNTALQGLGSLNTTNPSVADYSYNVNPFAR